MDTTPSTLKPAEVALFMVAQGKAKHADRYDIVLFKSFLAGVMLSFGGLLSQIMSGGSPGLTDSNPGIVKILGGFVFPVGLAMIVLQGQELLTSNMMVLPMSAYKKVIPWWNVGVHLIIVTFGNLAGSLFFGSVLVHYSGIISTAPYVAYIKSTTIHKAADPSFRQIFLRGIGCNWLVCIAVWQAAGARDTLSKIVALWFPIWVFVACGFDHVVANMYSIPVGIMFGADLTVAEYIRKSLIAAYLGNIVGALFVAAPAVYLYLGDYDAGGMRTAESGERRDGNLELRDTSIDNATQDGEANDKVK